ncbi:MAG TPA: protein kinase [Kofleriaceae bacterium]|nr:protein kinase [Kofleriaceae bacterium]
MPDPAEPDDEPTTIRPSPFPALVQDVAGTRSSPRGFAASLRGRVGKYELRDQLGRGAFGVVFTARDPSLDRDVAIKVLHPTHLANQEIVQRFLQEARAAARIAHPGIVTIHDCGGVEIGGGSTAFIAMELLSGESLTGRLARCGRLPPRAAEEIARQVASALEAAHRADVLHRDLKPDNIYLVPDPAMPTGERVKVLDFGLAKLGQEGHTQLQMVFGTPRYMSPEQCRSAAQVDHRSDIYALGCILFELVTGQLPFDGDVRQLIERHRRAIPPRASTLVAGLPSALDGLIAEMLAKDPMERPQTMGAVQRALQLAGTDAGPATDAERPGPTEAWAVGTDPARVSWLRRSNEPGAEVLVYPGASRHSERPPAPELRRDASFPADLSSVAGRSARPCPSEPFVITAALEPTTPDGFALDQATVQATVPTPQACPPGPLSGEILVPPSVPHAELAPAPHAHPRSPLPPDRRLWLWIVVLALLGASAGVLTCLALA